MSYGPFMNSRTFFRWLRVQLELEGLSIENAKAISLHLIKSLRIRFGNGGYIRKGARRGVPYLNDKNFCTVLEHKLSSCLKDVFPEECLRIACDITDLLQEKYPGYTVFLANMERFLVSEEIMITLREAPITECTGTTLAKRYNVSRTTIYNYMREMGITPPRHQVSLP